MPHGQLSRPVGWAGSALAIVAGLAAVACTAAVPNPLPAGGAGASPASPKATGSANTVSGSGAPLTGLAASSVTAARPAVAVDLGKGPQGLGSADVVFQEISSPVRYIAVFQSGSASGVGPVTGTQPTDSQVLSVMHPLLAYDGGTSTFVKVLDHGKVKDMGAATHSSLYSSTSLGKTVSTKAVLRAGRGSAPPAIFVFRDASSGNAALAKTGLSHPTSVRVSIPGYGSESWTYSSHSGRWTLTSGGPKISVANLVVQTVSYRQAFVNKKAGQTTPTARAIGGGAAQVFSGSAGASGSAAAGTWSKPHFQDVTNYFDKNDYPMAFQPGPTWVILAPRGTRVSMSGGQ
jgi:hypothetical protein